MKSAQTTQATQKTGSKGASPFDQIQELEKRESERVEKELQGMLKEKEEVAASILKKEDQTTEERRSKAKEELKEHSQKQLSTIMNTAKKEAEAQCAQLETDFSKREDSVVKDLVNEAKNPNSLFGN